MRKIVFGLALLLGALTLRATEDSYIYWLQGEATGVGVTVDDKSYDARIVAIAGTDATWSYGGGTYLTLYAAGAGGTPNTTVGYESLSVNLSDDNNPRYASISNLTGGNYTYFVELYNDDKIFARSAGVSDISAYVYTRSDFSIPSQGLSMNNFTPAAVPEPTSGLMLLLGSALLALRRKSRR